MTERPWETGKPPNDVWVEVEDPETEEVIEVRARWGRVGMRPHWENREGGVWWPEAFSRWRRLPVPTLWDHLDDE
jgi:hypothetical protein